MKMGKSNHAVVSAILGLGFAACMAAEIGLPKEPPPGVVVAASPDPDRIRYASPSIIRLPDGDLMVSHDRSGNPATTLLHRSSDGGKTWKHVADVSNVMWATLFTHDGALFLFGKSGGISDVVLRRSGDGGRTWSEAKDEHSGLIAKGGYHCGPVPVIVAKGRVWRAFERREDSKQKREFTAYVFSAPVGSDLLEASSWTKSEGVKWEPDWLQVRTREWIEGNVVVAPDGRILNILRTNTHPAKGAPYEIVDGPAGLKRFEVVAAMKASDDGKKLLFDPNKDFRSMPGAQSKFTIRFDGFSGKYFAVVSKITAPELRSYDWELSPHHQRNVLKMISSRDLITWFEDYTLLSYRAGDPLTKENPIGFQYADWIIDGEDMLVVSRTAWSEAPNYHDANHITFNRMENFREKKPEDSPPDLASL